ncbi:MAG: DUF805 domain-containing protein [Bacteroidales bacterium]|jgi:uncharacterized membrane protein YhaH (DUF805 family)|nr:DUF805 domain-containing protein [Bacteroidales bacterium]
MKWYLKCLRQYADFSGRARRKEFWMFTLFDGIFVILAMVLDSILIDTNFGDTGPVYLIYVLGTFIPTLAVRIRRLHDIGKSGWTILIALIPLVGAIILIVYMCTEGDPDNKYGEDPKKLEKREEYDDDDDDHAWKE